MKAAAQILSLVWIKGHTGFTGNEMADLYAKKAVKNRQITNIISRRDLKTEAKKRMINEWHNEWTETQPTKYRSYATVLPTLQQKPWFHNTENTRTTIITLWRLRFRYNCTPFHLYKIHFTDLPACDCDGI
jgi:hypothetical protein